MRYTTRFFIILFMLKQHILLGQTLSKQNLITDLNYLNEAVVPTNNQQKQWKFLKYY